VFTPSWAVTRTEIVLLPELSANEDEFDPEATAVKFPAFNLTLMLAMESEAVGLTVTLVTLLPTEDL
jgi:hypothetical protein